MFRNSAEPPALRTRLPDRQKTSAQPTAAAVTFQGCVWGKEENRRQFPQPFWKAPFDHLKHEVAGPRASLLPRGSCSSFLVSITQHPGSPSLCQVGQKPTKDNFAVLGERQIQNIPCGSSQPYSISHAGHARGDKITQKMSLTQPPRTAGLLDSSPCWNHSLEHSNWNSPSILKNSSKHSNRNSPAQCHCGNQYFEMVWWYNKNIQIFFFIFTTSKKTNSPSLASGQKSLMFPNFTCNEE